MKTLSKWCEENKEFGALLLKEWIGLDENDEIIDIDKIGKSSSHKVKWKCSICNKIFISSINNRTRLRNCHKKCGYIFNKTKQGINDLYTWCKNNDSYGNKLIKEFVGIDQYNNSINIHNIGCNSQIKNRKPYKVFWRCSKCSHEWLAKVVDRTLHKSGCPKCAKNVCIENYNDFYTWCIKHKEKGKKLLNEWVGIDEYNNRIDIHKISSHKHMDNNKRYRVYWRCTNCHNKWLTAINDRVSNNTGCPYCNKIGTSYPEQFIYLSLREIFPRTINRGKLDGYEIDIAVPELKLCIEYSPTRWHNTFNKVKRDKQKLDICNKYKLNFLYIREDSDNEYKEAWNTNYICFHMDDKNKKDQCIRIVEHILKQFNIDKKLNFNLIDKLAYNNSRLDS